MLIYHKELAFIFPSLFRIKLIINFPYPIKFNLDINLKRGKWRMKMDIILSPNRKFFCSKLGIVAKLKIDIKETSTKSNTPIFCLNRGFF